MEYGSESERCVEYGSESGGVWYMALRVEVCGIWALGVEVSGIPS